MSEITQFRNEILVGDAKEKLEELGHPAARPVSLYERIIETFTDEGDLVLDMFMGSGTTAIASVKTNRGYVGFEISEEYYDMIKDRLDNYEKQSSLSEYF